MVSIEDAERQIDEVCQRLHELADEAERQLRDTDRAISDVLGPRPAGPRALFHHSSHCMERVRDIQRLSDRMCENRKRLVSLDVMLHDMDNIMEGRRKRKITTQHTTIEHYMKLDCEAVFMFGTILLDQWVYVAAYALGEPYPEKQSFNRAVIALSKGTYKGSLEILWAQYRYTVIWLSAQLILYRNTFVVHADRPWQRSRTHRVYGIEYDLFTPSPPGWLNEEEVIRQIMETAEYCPESIRRLKRREGTRPREILEAMINNIGNIERHDIRHRIVGIAEKYGFQTVSFHILIERLLNFVVEATQVVRDQAIRNPERINLGRGRAQDSD